MGDAYNTYSRSEGFTKEQINDNIDLVIKNFFGIEGSGQQPFGKMFTKYTEAQNMKIGGVYANYDQRGTN